MQVSTPNPFSKPFSFVWLFLFVVITELHSQAWCQLGNFAVLVEFIYFSPSYDETYFVINGTTLNGAGVLTPSGKRVNNPVGFCPGFRLEGTYRFYNSCFSCGIRWTNVHAKSTESISNFDPIPQLWATEVLPIVPNVLQPFNGIALSTIRTMYQKAEIDFDEKVWHFFCCHFTLREAIEWSYLRYRESLEYFTAIGSERLQYHGHTKGIGPQLGIIALCEPYGFIPLCPRGLGLKCMATGSLIVANSKSKVKATDVLGVTIKVTQTSFWRIVPEFSFNLGIQYLRCIFCCPTTFEVGYELTTYVRGVSKLLFDEETTPGLSFNQYSDFCVHGLFAAIKVVF